jgi:hypothetical protein
MKNTDLADKPALDRSLLVQEGEVKIKLEE